MVLPTYRVFIFLLVLSSLLVLFLNDRLLRYQEHTHIPQRNISILLWHWPFKRSYNLDGNKCLEMYNISHCLLTDKTSSFSTADVVVFHHRELSTGSSILPLHLPRPPAQYWVWMSLESHLNNANVQQFNGLFNWTMSYRRDADIHIPYGQTLAGPADQIYRVPANHSCLVSWVVSRYVPTQKRSAVYQDLKRFIPIEVFGKWQKKPLTDAMLIPTISKCFFYLSFENTRSKDYISEKLWKNAFQAGVVPVVLGPRRKIYEALAPPHSFIHVDDFKRMSDLADYLRYVASNREVYEKYFQWHKTHRIKTITDWRERLCQICVNYSNLPTRKFYQDLKGWVYGKPISFVQ